MNYFQSSTLYSRDPTSTYTTWSLPRNSIRNSIRNTIRRFLIRLHDYRFNMNNQNPPPPPPPPGGPSNNQNRFTYAAVPAAGSAAYSYAAAAFPANAAAGPSHTANSGPSYVVPGHPYAVAGSSSIQTTPARPVLQHQITEFPSSHVTYRGDGQPEPPYRAGCQHVYSGNKQIKMKDINGQSQWGNVDSCSICGHVRAWSVYDYDQDRYWNGWS
ncbi:hypothetical protein BJ508DRAFT_327614 [Ascobolus immersus RN42]|uniref:Uncharacterized protein n=1 Tax=Ascobolus immersus RN42 TaxID=1160509 RepID=A0A3N4I7N4_ASCIM|nr:hypothetical protein BJ508DRAFT_327614 [Ascobolus immersus RN42]